MLMTLLELLSFDERVIVFSDIGEKVLITWNRSLTLQFWRQHARTPGLDQWEETEVRVLSEEPKTYEKAREKAIEWWQG